MDGHGSSSDLSSYFITQHHHLLPEGPATDAEAAGKRTFSPSPASAAGDSNPFAIPRAVDKRPSPSRPSPESGKRKRGRPRKYGALPSSRLLTLPIPAASKPSPLLLSSSPDSSSRKKKAPASNSSARKAKPTALGSAGKGFTPHVIEVSAGEDVVYKLVIMMQQLKRAVCVLSATGSVVNPSLCQSGSCSSITYEGKFEIVSLSGSLLGARVRIPFSRTGKLVTCLSGTDGRIVGGGIEGAFLAAGPVQVVVGTFLIDNALDASKSKKLDESRSNASAATDAGAALTSPVTLESTYVSSGRNAPFTGNDEHQTVVETSYLFHPRPMLPTIEWEGKQISGLGRICRYANDGEDFGE